MDAGKTTPIGFFLKVKQAQGAVPEDHTKAENRTGDFPKVIQGM